MSLCVIIFLNPLFCGRERVISGHKCVVLSRTHTHFELTHTGLKWCACVICEVQNNVTVGIGSPCLLGAFSNQHSQCSACKQPARGEGEVTCPPFTCYRGQSKGLAGAAVLRQHWSIVLAAVAEPAWEPHRFECFRSKYYRFDCRHLWPLEFGLVMLLFLNASKAHVNWL